VTKVDAFPISGSVEPPTPYLVLDRDIMSANIDRMAARCRSLGIHLRPHVKTPKSIPVAHSLLEAGAIGFTVSTLNEAEYLFSAGFDDIFYAVPADASKLARAAPLLRAGHSLSLLTDSLEGAIQLGERARKERVTVPVWVEIDVDRYRTGIDVGSPDFEKLIRQIANGSGTTLRGLMSYAGASYGCKSPKETTTLTECHRNALLYAATQVEALGLPRPKLSLGSTPAIIHARTLEGIDEARCGIYVFQDLFQAGIGACQISDIALSVVATVISHSQTSNRFTIDAGALALSKDRSTQGHPFDAKFGLVCDAASGVPIRDLQVIAVSQELGLVSSAKGEPLNLSEFPIGSKVRILPNHADMTAAAYEKYHVLQHKKWDTTWARTNRW
jgi:D-serine deaminase-like pyridoxal phosphate-dependent protein